MARNVETGPVRGGTDSPVDTADPTRRGSEPGPEEKDRRWSVGWGKTGAVEKPDSDAPGVDSTGWRPVLPDARPRTRLPRWWTVDLVFGAIVFGYGAAWLLAGPYLGVDGGIDGRLVTLYLRVFLFLFAWFGAMWWVALRYRIRSGKIEAPARNAVLLRAGSALWIFLLAALFSAVFTSVKVSIPEILPFAWDEALARADRFIHGTWEPWAFLQPVLGYPTVTRVLGYFYSQIYFLVTGAMLGWMAFHGDPRVRLRFFVAFALTWIILGNLIATILSSAGPAYYALVVPGPDPFAPLLAYLAEAAPSLSAVQSQLWAVQMGGVESAAPALGISAAPSLHVAVPALFAMVAWRQNRWIGAALWLFTSVMLIATVHLAWHYAIDGYMGVLGAGLILGLTDWLLGPRYSPPEREKREQGGKKARKELVFD